MVENRSPGCQVHRHDRVSRSGGDVALIYRDDLIVTEVAASSEQPFRVLSEIHTEFVIYLINGVNFDSIFVVVVYGPPKVEQFGEFLDRFSEFLGLTPKCIIAGDLNYDLCKATSIGHSELFSSYICQSVATCTSIPENWKVFEEDGLLKGRTHNSVQLNEN